MSIAYDNLLIKNTLKLQSGALLTNGSAVVSLPDTTAVLATTDTRQTLSNKTLVGDDIDVISASGLSYGSAKAPKIVTIFPRDAPRGGEVLTIAPSETEAVWVKPTVPPTTQISTSVSPVDIGSDPPKQGDVLIASSPTDAKWQALPPITSIQSGNSSVSFDSTPQPNQILTAVSSTSAKWQALPPVTELKLGSSTMNLTQPSSNTAQCLVAQPKGSLFDGVWSPVETFDRSQQHSVLQNSSGTLFVTNLDLRSSMSYIKIYATAYQNSDTCAIITQKTAFVNNNYGSLKQLGEPATTTFTNLATTPPQIITEIKGLTLGVSVSYHNVLLGVRWVLNIMVKEYNS